MSSLKIKKSNKEILVVSKLGKDEEINRQELDIMHSKLIRGLMKPNELKHNKISYMAPTGVTLKKYVSEGITVNDFFLVIAQILEAIKAVEKNSFNINNLVLNINYSFVNERTKELHLLYQPIFSCSIANNMASFLYDISYSVHLALSEDIGKINGFISFLKSQQVITVDVVENYILNNNSQTYKQVIRQKPGQSQKLRGDDLYYRQDDFVDEARSKYSSGQNKYYNDDDLDETIDTSVLIEDNYGDDDDIATSLLTSIDGGYNASDDEEDTTLLIGEKIKVCPYLLRLSTYDRIDINKPSFRIGKERSYVDYFVNNNTTVSRIHADIVSKEGRYFVRDNKSTNKTYVNGTCIPADKEIEIYDGDEITLANEKFEFHIN